MAEFSNCIKRGVSTEVGKRAHHLHQWVFRTRFPTNPFAQKYISLFIKIMLPLNYVKNRVVSKRWNNGQHFITMCGYILIDKVQLWFLHRCYNILRADLKVGRLKHINQLSSYDENKMVLTQRSLVGEMFKFSMRCLFPCIVSFRFVVLYATQSGNYFASSD